ncbi:MAG TPA: hypothetical protein VE404_10565, partial [Verrucomicrobiae bacterium]|nr:hypothetical protein [Verrucomicrobiae bacterium]
GVELERSLDEEDLPPILLADVGESDHDRGAILPAPGADVNLPGFSEATIGRRSSGKRRVRRGESGED